MPGSEALGLVAAAGQAPPTKEPLAIHHLQAIIKLELHLAQLSRTLDLVASANPNAKVDQQVREGGRSILADRFPKIFSQNFQQYDFIQKLNYLDQLTDRYNSEYLRWHQLCELNDDQLDRELLKILYVSLQSKMAKDPSYQLTEGERKAFAQNPNFGFNLNPLDSKHQPVQQEHKILNMMKGTRPDDDENSDSSSSSHEVEAQPPSRSKRQKWQNFDPIA